MSGFAHPDVLLETLSPAPILNPALGSLTDHPAIPLATVLSVRWSRCGGILLCFGHRFYQDRALFVRPGLASLCTPKFSAFSTVKEPLGRSDGDDHFAFVALHLHRASMTFEDGRFTNKRRCSKWVTGSGSSLRDVRNIPIKHWSA